MGAKLELRLVGERVMKACECVLHILQHGEVDLMFFKMPFKVKAEVA